MIVPINPDEHGPSGTNHLAVLFDLHVYQCSFQRGASNLQGDGRKPFPARNRVHEWGRKRTLSPFFQRITIIGDGFDIRNPLSMNILFPVRPEPGKQVFHGIIHKRRKHSSTIFCSQYRDDEWYEKLGGKDNPLTDAIMDRIAFNSYKIPITSLDPTKDISMREIYGLDPSEAE